MMINRRYNVLFFAAMIFQGSYAGQEFQQLVSNEEAFLSSSSVEGYHRHIKNNWNSKNPCYKDESIVPNRLAAFDDSTRQEEIIVFAKGVAPLMKDEVLVHCKRFIEHKQKDKHCGTFYKNMTVPEFVVRLYTKRPYVFFDGTDTFVLSNGKRGAGGFQHIGTDQEKDLLLKDLLSYDEMAISALFGISCDSFFIDNGARNIHYRPDVDHTQQGGISGIVGARFEKPATQYTTAQMEYKHMIITETQNTPENGYGKGNFAKSDNELLRLWAQFYDLDYFLSYQEAADMYVSDQSQTRVEALVDSKCCINGYMDMLVYKKRLKVSIESHLQHICEKHKDSGRKIYLHVTGIGLGAWLARKAEKGDHTFSSASVQVKCMMAVYEELLKKDEYCNIAAVNFSWFPGAEVVESFWQGVKTTATIFVSQRNRFDPLPEEYKDCYLETQFAWDGNAYVGNEYWDGIVGTDDPDAAKSSLIGSLQNPEINPYMIPNVVKHVLRGMQSFNMDTSEIKAEDIISSVYPIKEYTDCMLAHWKTIAPDLTNAPQNKHKNIGSSSSSLSEQPDVTKEKESEKNAKEEINQNKTPDKKSDTVLESFEEETTIVHNRSAVWKKWVGGGLLATTLAFILYYCHKHNIVPIPKLCGA